MFIFSRQWGGQPSRGLGISNTYYEHIITNNFSLIGLKVRENCIQHMKGLNKKQKKLKEQKHLRNLKYVQPI